MSVGTGSDLGTEAEAGLPRRDWGLQAPVTDHLTIAASMSLSKVSSVSSQEGTQCLLLLKIFEDESRNARNPIAHGKELDFRMESKRWLIFFGWKGGGVTSSPIAMSNAQRWQR